MGASLGSRSEPCWGGAYELVFLARNVGDVHIVGGRAQVLELLAGEDVNSDKMNLGVTVLASLGGGHVDNLAGAVLDHDEAVLAEGRALHGVSGRRAGVNRLEGVVMLYERRLWSATLSPF